MTRFKENKCILGVVLPIILVILPCSAGYAAEVWIGSVAFGVPGEEPDILSAGGRWENFGTHVAGKPKKQTTRSRIFSVGASAGLGLSTSDEALQGFSETEFHDSHVYTGSIILFLPVSRRTPVSIGFEVAFSKSDMELLEPGENYGILTLNPIMVLLRIQHFPDEHDLGFHANIGGGVFKTSFEKGRTLRAIENELGVDYVVDTDESSFFALGGGLDAFISQYVSLSFDVRSLHGNIGTTWTICAPEACAVVPLCRRFSGSHVCVEAGVRLWF